MMNEELIKKMVEINSSINALTAITGVRAKMRAHIEKNKESLLNSFYEQNERLAEVAATTTFSPALISLEQHVLHIKEAHNDLAEDPPEILKNIGDSDVLTEAVIYADETLGTINESKELETEEYTGAFSLNIVLNERQLMAKEMALTGKSFVLIGAAGTGKTTTQRSVAESLLESESLQTSQFRDVSGPSIAFVAYTRRATANLQRAIHKNPDLEDALKHNIMTIHALLEFTPETYYDNVEEKEKFRFAPRRTAMNPLTITHLVIEEASMLGLDLWAQLYDALPVGVQIIFIGDINQLPPVFGPSILNYALVQLPIIELTEVYRNGGIILENAHNILGGKEIVEDPDFVIIRGKAENNVGQSKTAAALFAPSPKTNISFFETLYNTVGDDGLPEYSPDDCIILSPFNKQDLGTDNLNKWIAQFLGAKRNAIVHEVIAGFNKVYLAIGDKVMFNKQDGIIKSISRNSAYHGKEPQVAGSDMTRFGVRIIGESGKDDLDDLLLDYEGFSLEALEKEAAQRKMQASHMVDIVLENGQEVCLSAAGDFGPAAFSLGYVLTVHKAQGSEWRKVFIIAHKDHSVLLFRELFYTAVTRARKKVTIIAKEAIINKAIRTQRIKGNTLQDKLEYFNSGTMSVTDVCCEKVI